ncbi:hypothetical protein CDD81_3019 [Ophiocordyceps australis]|uniref:Uncharacterized protein n=1 Tax=Ophiocordyceps australis TaxID=1399860 RepID=A0A2C5YID4_9HYPO|nr:hypothetical protein CDD81_3019 [Ophiocordyceps australis]
MCVYARTIFECRHQQWGRRVKLCPDAQASRPCGVRQPHGLQSRRVTRLCYKCHGLHVKCALARSKLEECRAAFNKAFPQYVLEPKAQEAAEAMGQANNKAASETKTRQQK